MKKIVKYLGIALSVFLLSCQDFLEVSSPSKFDTEYVFNKTTEDINNALSAVYASLMDNNTYGESFPFKYVLNSDVELKPFTNSPLMRQAGDFACFDGDKYSGDILNTWQKSYEGIERANIFIKGVEASPLMNGEDRMQLRQWLGEAKCIRAMFYHDLVTLWGDLPFRTTPAYGENLYIGLTDRQEILSFLIDDLKSICSDMKWASEVTVERASKEFCFGLIARMALTRAGYALYPDKNNPSAIGTMQRPADYLDYYEIARDYADSVIVSEKHQLVKSFRQVFVDQCNFVMNNQDDMIFELPFQATYSGRVGYDTGPNVEGENDATTHNWGPSSGGGLRLNPLYVFSFDDKDLRRDFTVSRWDYAIDPDNRALSIPKVSLGVTVRVGKWSKLWNTAGLGKNSTAYTGFNYPYMRYAEMLLTYAEAVNEINNGPTEKAKDALKAVRTRAFNSADHGTKVEAYVDGLSSKDDFFEAIFNERAWEFGGEGMRWKDLVRWNLYSRVVYEQFKAMKVIAWRFVNDSNPDSDYEDPRYDDVPQLVYYNIVNNPANINVYPNLGGSGSNNLRILDIAKWPKGGFQSGYTNYDAWFDRFANKSTANPADAVLYSFRGYIYGGTSDGSGGPTVGGNDRDAKFSNIENLPPVRYILPIPNLVIVTHNSAFGNYYGYY